MEFLFVLVAASSQVSYHGLTRFVANKQHERVNTILKFNNLFSQ